MIRTKSSSLYTIQFKNGDLLRHQSPLQLAQFRCDARLSTFWIEFEAGINRSAQNQE
jgi:hypothetical protein